MTTRLGRKSFIAILALSLSLAGGVAVAGSCSASKTANIVETAKQAGSFGTLLAAVQAAGLVDALEGNGPLTVFAPTDEAFAKLPAGTVEELLKPENKKKLQSILTYHVVSGAIYSQDARPGRVETLEGSELRVSERNGNLMIDQARVISADIATSNGVIHVIDEVIMPGTNRASSTESADEMAMNLP
jgi:uncharacterized surface protein with fasciclin (FAS1) repeats